MQTFRLYVLIWLLTLPTYAFAYLDPGSGSMLLYFIIGVFATLIYSIKEFFYQSITLLTSGKVNKSLQKITSANILFYSEGKQYWQVFKPVIKALNDKNINCVYYTSDKDDAGLLENYKNLQAYYIGSIQKSIMLLNRIKVPIVIMTTPQLDVKQLKKSDAVQYYIHLIHAPTDVLNYQPFAFDYFDCVMCSGQHQIDNLKLLEKIRNTKGKILLKTGLTYYDELLNKKINQSSTSPKTILVSPTWGKDGLLFKYGFSPIEILLKADFEIILRPHPQSYVSEQSLMNKIEESAKKYKNITIDKSADANQSMASADIMLSDISGIIFDFVFGYEKPVVVFESELDASRLSELNDINANGNNQQLWEIAVMNKIATILKPKDISNIADIIKKTSPKITKQTVQKLRDESIFNYGFAGKTAANQLESLIKDLK